MVHNFVALTNAVYHKPFHIEIGHAKLFYIGTLYIEFCGLIDF